MEPAWHHKVEEQKSKKRRERRNESKSEEKKGDTAWSRAEDMGLVSPAKDTAY